MAELSAAAYAATLELSRLRSTLMVGAALVARFPTEESWEALVSDPEYIESLNALAEVLQDIQKDPGMIGGATEEAVAEATERHYGRAVETIDLLAERLQVPPEDLLNVLIHL